MWSLYGAGYTRNPPNSAIIRCWLRQKSASNAPLRGLSTPEIRQVLPLYGAGYARNPQSTALIGCWLHQKSAKYCPYTGAGHTRNPPSTALIRCWLRQKSAKYCPYTVLATPEIRQVLPLYGAGCTRNSLSIHASINS